MTISSPQSHEEVKAIIIRFALAKDFGLLKMLERRLAYGKDVEPHIKEFLMI